MNTTLNGRAIGSGLLTSLAILLPTVLIARIIVGDGELDGNGVATVTIIAFVAIGAAGFVAGRRELDAPALHGAATGVATYVIAQLVASVLRGSTPNPLSLILAAMIFACVGALGGSVAAMRNKQPTDDPHAEGRPT